MTIAAVVVTYNRKDLLAQCLRSLLAQTRSIDRIYIIDNASTDGTQDLLKSQGFLENPKTTLIPLQKNLGGAGGFYVGLKQAHADGHEWIWIMDDDTDPSPTALAALLHAHDSFPTDHRPVLLASRAEWTDGSLHPMNRVAVKQRHGHGDLWLAASKSCISIRSATFVSILIHRSAIDRHGLPIPGYFLWCDDVEYTARILRHEFGVAVPASVVIHRTAKPYATLDAAPNRYYLHLRNSLWMLTRSNCHDRAEKLERSAMLAFTTLRWIWHQRFHPSALWAICRAFCAGMFTKPNNVAPTSVGHLDVQKTK